MSEHNPRAFIDMNGGYQSHREGAEKLAHDAWVNSNTWGLTRDDFIRLSYFHGDLENGSDGLGPVNGSEDRPDDAVYIGANGGVLSRSMVSSWLADCNSFMHGYKTAVENAATQPPQDERGQRLTDAQIEQIWLNARDDKNELKAAIYFARAILAASAPAQQPTLQPVAAELEDAQRYRWLKAHLLCADFQYGDLSESCSALVFEIPESMRVSVNLDETIDAALAGTGSDESKKGEA